jgi:hypothetical protein
MKSTFLNDYKVLIIGLLSAVALALNEVFKTGGASTKALVFAAFVAAVSFLANNLRGQWATIAGIVGTTLTTYITMEQNGTISWQHSDERVKQALVVYIICNRLHGVYVLLLCVFRV